MSETEDQSSKAKFAMIEFAQPDQTQNMDLRKKNSRLVRKLDLYIAPVMMLLMLISYLDRGNIGFAATQGMTVDINLQGTQLNVSDLREKYPNPLSNGKPRLPFPFSTSFMSLQRYVIFLNLQKHKCHYSNTLGIYSNIDPQFPASLLVKRLQFNRVIPTITISWGLVCMCNGFINNFAGLCACRLILGLLEGCLFPSLTLFMANWYLREELATRISYLFSEVHCWRVLDCMANIV